MLLISDSICKHVANIDWLEVIVIPGANIFSIHQYIRENKARIRIFSHLLLHVGTNDIANGLSVNLTLQYYTNLLELIQSTSTCHVVISGILPRPVDFLDSKQHVIQVNNNLAALALRRKALFVKTYKPFVQQPGSLPVRKYFAKDGLHLSKKGVSVIRNFYIGVVNHLR